MDSVKDLIRKRADFSARDVIDYIMKGVKS